MNREPSPCFVAVTVCEIDGDRYAVAISRFAHAFVAWPDPAAVTSGWGDAAGMAEPDPELVAKLLRSALAAPTADVPLPALLEFAGPPCATCGDRRTVPCKPCDRCDWDGWDLCTCSTSSNRPAHGFPKAAAHYERGLIGATIRSMAISGVAQVGEANAPGRKKGVRELMLIIRCGDDLAGVMEVRTVNDSRVPFPKFRMPR